MQKKNNFFGHSKIVYKSERNIIAHNQGKGADKEDLSSKQLISPNIQTEEIELSIMEIDSSDSSISGQSKGSSRLCVRHNTANSHE